MTEYMTAQVIITDPQWPVSKWELVDSAISSALRHEVKSLLVGEFNKRITGWKFKPVFVGRYTRPGQNFELDVHPTGSVQAIRQYRWVTGGTRPHTEPLRGNTYMSFRETYHSHTKPAGVYGRSSGGTYSGDRIVAHVVEHPGIDAREFEVEIAEDKIDDVVDIVEKAISEVLKL